MSDTLERPVQAVAAPGLFTELTRVVRAELFKMARRPALWLLLAASVVLQLIFSYLIPFVSYLNGSGPAKQTTPAMYLDSTLPGQVIGNMLSGLPVFVGALGLTAGALVTGSEFGWGTVKALFTQRPSRSAMVGGQLVAIVVAAAVTCVIQLGAGTIATTSIALGEARSLAFPTPLLLLEGLGAGWLILSMFMLAGSALAMLSRGVALSVGLGVVWVLGIENLISGMASSVLSALQPLRDVLPGQNAGSLVTAVMPARVLDPPPGVNASVGEARSLVTLLAYVVCSAALTIWLARRRDVT